MNNRLAIMMMAVAVVLLSSNDAIFKFLGDEIPMGQAIALRGVFLVTLLILTLKISGDAIRKDWIFERWSMLRAVCELIATFFFLFSLSRVPLAVATTLVFTSPIILTAISGPLFKERVGPWRWLAVIAGFGGVLMITWRGNSGDGLHILMPMVAAIFVAGRDITTRFVPKEIPPASVVLTTALLVLAAGCLTAFGGWVSISLVHTSMSFAAAVLVGISFYLGIHALRIGELSLLAPVQYIVIICSLIFGAVFWNEIPDARAMLGGAIVIASGLLILWREKVNRAKAA